MNISEVDLSSNESNDIKNDNIYITNLSHQEKENHEDNVDIDDLFEAFESLKDKYMKLKGKNSILERDVYSLNLDKKALQETLDELRGNSKELNGDDPLQDEINMVKSSLSEITNEKKILQTKLVELEVVNQENESMRDMMKLLRIEIEELRAKSLENEKCNSKEMKRLENECNSWKTKCNSLEKKKRNVNKKIRIN